MRPIERALPPGANATATRIPAVRQPARVRRTRDRALTADEYQTLLRDITACLEHARESTRSTAASELVGAYWSLGRRIAAAKLSERAGYASQIVRRLALDLNMPQVTLHRAVLFSRLYARVPTYANLSWVHYRELLQVHDPDARAYYAALASEHAWSSQQLVSAIRARRHLRESDAHADAPQLTRPRAHAFVFEATVLSVIDGDTLLLLVDLGFDVRKEHRVRLACIDAPELSERGGLEAQTFVTERLMSATCVMLHTEWHDRYGRYVGHVFYSTDPRPTRDATFRSGAYLNQELLTAGLAKWL